MKVNNMQKGSFPRKPAKPWETKIITVKLNSLIKKLVIKNVLPLFFGPELNKKVILLHFFAIIELFPV